MPWTRDTGSIQLWGWPIPLLIAVALAAPALAGEPEPRTLAPILEFSEVPGALEGPDAGPSLALYADGTLVVVYPPTMRRAGRYVARLDAVELQSLLELARAPGVIGFDASAIRAELRHTPRSIAKSHVAIGSRRAGDETISSLTIASDVRSGVSKPGALRRTIRWQGVARDAAAHPSISALQDLERARRALRAQLRRADLAPE